jgi:hypothetical protein
MPLTDYDNDNIGPIIRGRGDWFTARLIRLIARADTSNKKKLAQVFPKEVAAVQTFQTGKPNL